MNERSRIAVHQVWCGDAIIGEIVGDPGKPLDAFYHSELVGRFGSTDEAARAVQVEHIWDQRGCSASTGVATS